MKYLITGGAGFIGSNLSDKLIESGHEVVVIDNLSTGKIENVNQKAEFFKADICNFEEIVPFFKGIDGVFHLAAIPRIPISIEDPVGTYKTNVLGTVNVFKASLDAGVKRIIFASSSSVYGSQKTMPLTESMLPNPISPYGLQKLMGEQIANMFFNFYKIPIVCLRYFNVYGPKLGFDSDYSLVIGKFLRLKKEGKSLTIFGTGEQTRGFCYVDDIVSANIVAMESKKIKGGEVINIGQEESYSVNYIAKKIGGDVEYMEKRQGDPLSTQADISRAKEILCWIPKVGIEDGISKTIVWFNKKIASKT